MKRNRDILLIEMSLEEALVEEKERRTQQRSFQAMLDSFGTKSSRLYYERVQDLQGLKGVFKQCAEQYGQKRAIKGAGGMTEPTRIGYIHISHGYPLDTQDPYG
jgi:hypothetical protein